VKLHLSQSEGHNQITSYGSGFVAINGQRQSGSLLVAPSEPVRPWPVAAPNALSAEHLAALLEFAPELVLIGTGASLLFPPACVLRPLVDANIGYEIMDTPAACRTYNILMAEGRRVLAALIVG
jgi:uncharacterized protein